MPDELRQQVAPILAAEIARLRELDAARDRQAAEVEAS
jgi:hypothetical protein